MILILTEEAPFWSPEMIAAIMAFIGVIVAAYSVFQAASNFNKSQEPYIGVYLTSMDPENRVGAISQMVLNIKNFGQQAADSVKVVISNDFNRDLLDSDGDYSVLTTSLFSEDGLSYLAPSQKQSFYIADLTKLFDEEGEAHNKLELTITWSFGKKTRSSVALINFDDYKWNSGSEQSGFSKVMKYSKTALDELKSTNQQLSKLNNTLLSGVSQVNDVSKTLDDALTMAQGSRSETGFSQIIRDVLARISRGRP